MAGSNNKGEQSQAQNTATIAHINRFGVYDLDEEREVTDLDFDLNPEIFCEHETRVEQGYEAVLALNH